MTGIGTKTNPTLSGYGVFVVRRRWPIILLGLVLIAASIAGVRYLKITSDNRAFFSPQNPQLIALEALEATFTRNNNALIAVAPRGGDAFSRGALDAVEQLTERLWRAPFAMRVDSLTNFQYSRADGDDLVVTDLVRGAKNLTPADLATVRDAALADPLLVNRLVSPDGAVAGINVNFLPPGESIGEIRQIAAYLYEAVDRVQKQYPEIDIYLTGPTMLSAAFGQAALRDLKTLIPFVLIANMVAMIAMFRSIPASTISFVTSGLAAAASMGLAGWLGIVFNPASITAPIAVLVLTTAHNIHIVTGILEAMRRGLGKSEAIADSLRRNLYPVILTGITTVIGFLSLNASDAPPFKVLGNVTAIGVVVGVLLALAVTPALAAILPIRAKVRAAGKITAMERLAGFVIARRTPLLIASSLAVLAIAAGMARIEFSDDFVKYFDRSYRFRTDTDIISDRLTGYQRLEYGLPAGQEGGISEPAYLSALDDFANWYRAQPGVVHVATLTDIVMRLNKNMNGDDPAFYRVPETRELAAQYLLMYEMNLPYGLDLNNQIDVAKSATRVTVTAANMSSRDLRALDTRAWNWLRRNAPDMAVPGSGLAVVFAYLSQRNIESMLYGTAAALLLVSAILVLALRSLRIGLVSLVPNLVPAAMAFGLWGYLIGEVGMAISVVAAMTFGIVVDDTIHFLSNYLKAQRAGASSADAVRHAFRHAGAAMWTTTAVLVAGYGVQATSGFQINWGIGLLAAFTLGFALLADFFLLPPLLMALERTKR